MYFASGIFNYSFSQTGIKKTFLPPRFIFELSGSFNVPIGSARGDIIDFFNFKNYGLVNGIGFHFNIKYAANKSASLYPYITIGFSQLQNDDRERTYIDSNIISNGYPLPGNNTFAGTFSGLSLLVLRDMYAGIGLQYILNTKHKILPYAGIEINYHRISGFYEQTPGAVLGNEPAALRTFTINSASRFGAGIDVGADFRIAKNLGFLFGAQYKIANLLGRESLPTKPASENPSDLNTINLLDKAAPELNSHLSQDRNISYLQFYVGFTVFAGKR